MDFNPQSYDPNGIAIFGKDDQLLVKFFRHPELSQIKSKNSGMPIYDDVTMVEVLTPGEKDPVRVLADEMHKRRFPKQWEAYQTGQDLAQSGTPLDHLFPAEPGAVLSLKAFHIFTIQQLASLSDTAIGNIPMGRTLVDRATAYVASAQGGKTFHAMEAMQKQLDDMRALLVESGIEPPVPAPEPKRGPGRPRKEIA